MFIILQTPSHSKNTCCSVYGPCVILKNVYTTYTHEFANDFMLKDLERNYFKQGLHFCTEQTLCILIWVVRTDFQTSLNLGLWLQSG